ncbi:hypothetical protein [Paenibacillus sp. FSL E2-0178]|uniref:hypothetical protein n=1 Tax=Paenibacillus sp. FSL E2-0178 TaxID=2921361 RepID=UPI003157FBE6
MILRKYIENQMAELKQSQKYKDVIFAQAKDVELKRFGTSEGFIAISSDMDKGVIGTNHNFTDFTDEFQKKGVKITYVVLEKRKRKYTDLNLYAVYK